MTHNAVVESKIIRALFKYARWYNNNPVMVDDWMVYTTTDRHSLKRAHALVQALSKTAKGAYIFEDWDQDLLTGPTEFYTSRYLHENKHRYAEGNLGVSLKINLVKHNGTPYLLYRLKCGEEINAKLSAFRIEPLIPSAEIKLKSRFEMWCHQFKSLNMACYDKLRWNPNLEISWRVARSSSLVFDHWQEILIQDAIVDGYKFISEDKATVLYPILSLEPSMTGDIPHHSKWYYRYLNLKHYLIPTWSLNRVLHE